MTRTTPPRPLDVEALFPELAAHRGTTTRLHPRPGSPSVSDSSVGGPLLWPVDEAWPVCTEAHERGRGRRPADIHQERRVLAAAWSGGPAAGPTDGDRRSLDELRGEHRVLGIHETDPLPMIGVAQLYRRDIPDLPAGPGDRDLLQVFWCPFDAHGRSGYGMSLDLRWRRSWEVGEVLTTPPSPQVVGYQGYVAEPCVLYPEQVVTYPFAGLLPEELRDRIDAWEDALEEEAEAEDEAKTYAEIYTDTDTDTDTEADESSDGKGAGPPMYQYDLSIPPGWRAGGFASWHLTDACVLKCSTCATPMELLLTVASSEWDGGSGSWKPLEESDLPAHRFATPTQVTVGRWGVLNIFACPTDPAHPHRQSIQ
ncbi:hypothetical protein [Streptomyces sp. NBC_01506]|uniref:hypothetical protein n=1 Tax=Streptomyces sp. NBC_01506 TaxID=2903887 RepID=UPI003869A9F2